MTLTSQAVLAELDAALTRAPATWRSTALRQIVDLFVAGAPDYSGEQVALFDEVIGRLMQDLDRAPLVELSRRLAPIENAPLQVIGRLARHNDLAVCGPILERATALPDADIVEIAGKDGVDQELLMTIARRRHLSMAVTDVLLKRGSRAIQRSIIDNPKAPLSEVGFAWAIMCINGDKDFAAAIAARNDVVPELRVWLARVLSEVPGSPD